MCEGFSQTHGFDVLLFSSFVMAAERSWQVDNRGKANFPSLAKTLELRRGLEVCFLLALLTEVGVMKEAICLFSREELGKISVSLANIFKFLCLEEACERLLSAASCSLFHRLRR